MRPFHKRRLDQRRGLAATLSILLCIGCASEEAAPVRIGYLQITASLPLFIAQDLDLFSKEGVAVETVRMASSNQLIDGLVSGHLDVVVESSAVPALAVELQSPGRIKVFAASSITKDAPFDALLTRSGSPLRTLSDLAERKVGVFPGSTATALLRRFLTDRGVDLSNTEFVPIPPQNHLSALLEGSVHVVHAYEPTIAIAAVRGGTSKLYGSVYAEMIDSNPQGVAVVAAAFVAERETEASKTIRALEQAMRVMRSDENGSRLILARHLGLDTPVADASTFLYMLPHDEIDVSILQRYSDMLTDIGELRGRVRVSELVYP